MSVSEDVRAAQRKQFEQDGLPESAAESTFALYDQLDALSSDQRSLVVDHALAMAQNIGQELITVADENQRLLLHTGLHALIAVAGYCNSIAREESNWTSLSDKKVADVLDAVRDLIRETATSALPEDQQELIAAVAPSIKQRVAAGEDYETVAMDEVAKYRKDHPRPDGKPAEVIQGQVVSSKADTDDAPGFYL